MSRGRLLIVGTGPGDGYMTPRALELMRSCGIFAGGDAALATAPAWGMRVRIAGPLDVVIAEIGGYLHRGDDVCVLTSGDPGYFSMLAALQRAFPGEAVVEPGVASVQLLAARVGVPWQEFVHLSAHGRALDLNPASDRPCAVLCGGENTPSVVAAHLLARGFVGRAAVGVRLGWPDETVTTGTLAETVAGEFDSPAVLAAFPDAWLEAGGWTLRPRGATATALSAEGTTLSPERSLDEAASSARQVAAPAPRAALRAPGVPDEDFERVEKVPLSRWEVRAVLAAVARPGDRRVIWDVGAGSGGFAVEMALQSPLARVLAFERDSDGCAAIRANAAKFGVRVEVVQGEAPEILAMAVCAEPTTGGPVSADSSAAGASQAAQVAAPVVAHPGPVDGAPAPAQRASPPGSPRAGSERLAPDLVVIGGSGGRLEGVLTTVERVLAPGGRVIVTGVTLDTVGTASRVLSASPWTGFDALQVSSARLDRAGIMRGMNPITLLWADKAGRAVPAAQPPAGVASNAEDS